MTAARLRDDSGSGLRDDSGLGRRLAGPGPGRAGRGSFGWSFRKASPPSTLAYNGAAAALFHAEILKGIVMQAEIKGTTMPILEVSLDRGEQVVSAHGELAWMTASIQMSQTTNTGGGGGGFMQGLKRVVGGGGLFLTRYEGPGSITFAAKVPGHIVPVDIGPGQTYMVHRHGWLCGTPGITPSVGMQQSFRGGIYGGDGFILQKLEGQGRAWVELSGELTSYELPPGQTLLAHPGHIGMFQGTVQFQITRMRGIANAFFGGDGFHLVALTGPGRVWLQSMPLSNLAHALAPYLPKEGARDAVAGGAVGGIIGDMLRG